MIIDRADCDVGLPSLEPEATQHSPLTHMKMQSVLIRQLFAQFGLTKNLVDPADVQRYQCTIEAWIRTFPPPFDIHNPDKSLDESCPWIVLHRHYVRTMAFSMLLDPVRAFLARAFTIDASEAELKIRGDGIDYCLELMFSLRGFFDHVFPRDAKYHWVLFCIFDTSTVLCSAILHDEHHTLPRREDIFEAIDEAHTMLQRLRMVTKSARASYGILTRIVQRLPRTAVTPIFTRDNPASKRVHLEEAVISPQTVSSRHGAPLLISPPTTASTASFTPAPTAAIADVSRTSSLVPVGNDGNPSETYAVAIPLISWQPEVLDQGPTDGFSINELPSPDTVFASISDEELGELAISWNYQSLDFGFVDPSPLV